MEVLVLLFLGIGIGYVWAVWGFVSRVRNGTIEQLILKIREQANGEVR
jgi:hypothetical protein